MSVAKMFALFACVVVLTMQSTTLAQNTQQDYLDSHNAARSAVSVADISWDDTVQAYAENYANQRKSDCSLVHSGGQYGENLFMGSSTSYTGVDAVNLWVNEKQYYDYNTNTCASGETCGHYTQVVWRHSTQLGCARVECDNNAGVFIICSYNPPGNYNGEKPY
ncbi:pathogenesis-related protein 1-like protein [Carex littledalei]|uniref:Pathogenesis-related protein 1-like protein n=1 Tax=Carex littledalei TaxID=544730 RepID=A0A833S297_9POAL|nr:pathogenesis-related protein 1-like protein [Carex littledalei]